MGSHERKSQEKLIRKNDILKAAEKIFIQKGYESSTMDEIAADAEYTKRTVYQYFPAKEDIYFALALNAFEKLMEDIGSVFSQGICGLEKLQKAGEAYMLFYLKYPDQFLIMSRARSIHTREAESVYHQGIVRYQQRMFELFGQAIEQGKNDGSIKKDIDAKLSTFFLVSASVSLFSELAENRERMEQVLDVSLETYMRFSLERLVESLIPSCSQSES